MSQSIVPAYVRPLTYEEAKTQLNSVDDLYSMKIKEQTRKLAASCSKHCFEVADRS